MTQVIDIDTAHAARYETPAFAPGVAFAWTLRSGEIARLQRAAALRVAQALAA